MSLLTVYRVENAQAQGPYFQGTAAAFSMGSRHTDAGYSEPLPGSLTPSTAHLHPSPAHDLGWRWQRMTYTQTALTYVFGFPSTERLGQWFFGERDTLELLNMHVAAYEVPHQAVVRGEWQLAFRRPSATLVRTLPLAGLVE